MNVLVTGGTGFLGHALARRLRARGDTVTILGRNDAAARDLVAEGARFARAELSDADAVGEACRGQEIVVHAGGLASPWGKMEEFVRANVVGTRNVLAGCRAHGVRRLVHVSTPSVYFDWRDRLDIRESDPLPPRMATAYAETKLAADRDVDAASAWLETISIRPSRIFGPGDRNILPRVLRANERGGLPLVRGGQARVDMTYVENVVDALALCIDATKDALGLTYNITNGEPLPLRTLAEKICSALGERARFRALPFSVAYGLAAALEAVYRLTGREDEPPLTRYAVGLMSKSQTLDITRAREKLGYAPRVSIDEGVRRFAEWWTGR